MKKKNIKKNQVKDENIFHVKLTPNEAVRSRKDVLSTQMDLLKIVMIIKGYHALRMEELDRKKELVNKLKGLNAHFRKLEQTLPKIKIPKILLKEERYHEVKETVKEIKAPKYSEDLETQIQDIQNKLKAMAG